MAPMEIHETYLLNKPVCAAAVNHSSYVPSPTPNAVASRHTMRSQGLHFLRYDVLGILENGGCHFEIEPWSIMFHQSLAHALKPECI